MKFNLRSTKHHFHKDNDERPILEALGFTFDKNDWVDNDPEIEVSSLEDLLSLTKATGGMIVISFEDSDLADSKPEIEIYNGYRE